MTSGGDNVAISIEESRQRIGLIVIDNDDGTYTAKYKPTSQTTLFVHVDVDHLPLSGSPFAVMFFSSTPLSLIQNGSSRILDSDSLKSTLFDMLPKDRRRLTLLHDDRNGATQTHFWRAVINKAHILVVIKSSQGHVFGGYVEDQFIDRGSKYIAGSDRNFLFRLTGQPLKLLRTSSRSDATCLKMSPKDVLPGFFMDGLAAFSPDSLINVWIGSYSSPAYEYPMIGGGLSAVTLSGIAGWQLPQAMEVYQCSE